MYTSIITVASLCAVAFAVPEQIQERQAPALASILSSISSLQSQLQPPASLIPLLTGIPASVTAALANPTALAALQSDFIVNGPPAWYTSLAPEGQAYVLALAPKAQSILPQIASLEAAAAQITASGAAPTAGSPSAGSPASPASSLASSAATRTSAAANSGASSSSSSAGAAQHTGAVAAGMIAAGSFLGLALAL